MRLGIDIGGTKIEGALVTEKGKVKKRKRVLTEAGKGHKKILNNVISVIKELDEENIEIIGVSIAGVTDSRKLYYSPNIRDLEGLELKKILEKKTGKKVFLENDANCFALAEQKFGAARGYDSVLGLILGTGVGGGIITHGRIYKGLGGAGEVGHMTIETGKTFEELCAGPGIINRYIHSGGKIEDPDPKKIMASREKAARKTAADTYKYIGVGIANLINILHPEVVVIGGGLSNLDFYDDIRAEVKKQAIPLLGKTTLIKKNELGDSSGVIGAAFLGE